MSKVCRICYETETFTNKIISPCQCCGDCKYIHESCLWLWLESNKSKYNSTFLHPDMAASLNQRQNSNSLINDNMISRNTWNNRNVINITIDYPNQVEVPEEANPLQTRYPKCEICKTNYWALFYFKLYWNVNKRKEFYNWWLFKSVKTLWICTFIGVLIFTFLHFTEIFNQIECYNIRIATYIFSFTAIVKTILFHFSEKHCCIYNKAWINWRIWEYDEERNHEYNELSNDDVFLSEYWKNNSYSWYPFIFKKT